MMRMTKAVMLLVLVLVLIGAFIVVSAESKGGEAKAVPALSPQKTCPVMGGAINKELYVDHEGKRIYVCCAGCIDAIKKDPEAAIGKLEKEGQSVAIVDDGKKLTLQTNCPVMKNNRINTELFVDHGGQRIYVCCDGCLKRVKKAPVKYIGILESRGQRPEKISEEKAL